MHHQKKMEKGTVLNKNIDEKLSEINMKVIDRLWFNEEAQRVKSLINLKIII